MQSELHLGRCSLHGKRWATKEPKKFHILVYVLQCVTIHTTTGCYGEEKRKKKLHMVYYLHYTLEHKNHDMCVLASFAKVQKGVPDLESLAKALEDERHYKLATSRIGG